MFSKLLQIFLIAVFIFLLGIISCAKNEVVHKTAKQELVQKTETSIPDSLKQKSIITAKTNDGFFRLFVKSNEPRGNYFYADTLNVLIAEQYRFEGGKEKLILQQKIFETEWSYLEIDSANLKLEKVNGREFLFFATNVSNMGKAIQEQEVNFWMLNINDPNEYFRLDYIGYPTNLCASCIKGTFSENKALEKLPAYYRSLKRFAELSPLIYHPSAAEKNAGHYKNYREKWQKDNNVDSVFGAGFIGEMDEVFSTYYQENLFDINDGSESRIENDRYLIMSYFRGDLIAYDKLKKLYFPVIVESCAHFCNKEVEFVDDVTIKITYEDMDSWDLNLAAIKFDN